MKNSGKKRFCYDYPRPAVTVDVVVVSRKQPRRVLLIRRKHEPFADMWAIPGGFIDIEEAWKQPAGASYSKKPASARVGWSSWARSAIRTAIRAAERSASSISAKSMPIGSSRVPAMTPPRLPGIRSHTCQRWRSTTPRSWRALESACEAGERAERD
jgi:hypothetical protein